MRSLLFIGMFSALAGTAAAATLGDLQWQNRVIAVFACSDNDASATVETLSNTDGIAERDIAWFVVSPNGVQSNIDKTITPDSLRALHAADGFEAVLIGKDGGVKSRQTDHLDIQAFFGEIDQMPMRQQEMRQQ